ncbi:MAG: hypothetical protein CME20_20170, partial [Gemmatimonadetes bacterium]|nr:hypothetical protein [Gemmatimonadota bacterium]
MGDPRVFHLPRQQHVVLERRTPAIVRARNQLVAFVVGKRQEHAHTIALFYLLFIVRSDPFPALALHFLSILFNARRPVVPLRRLALTRPPPGQVAVPAQRVVLPAGVTPEQPVAQDHVFAPQALAPGRAKPEEFVRSAKLRKNRLLERWMDNPADRPRLVVARAVDVTFGGVDAIVADFRGTGRGQATPGFTQPGDPGAAGKVVDDHEPVLLEMRQPLARRSGRGVLRLEIGKRRGAVGWRAAHFDLLSRYRYTAWGRRWLSPIKIRSTALSIPSSRIDRPAGNALNHARAAPRPCEAKRQLGGMPSESDLCGGKIPPRPARAISPAALEEKTMRLAMSGDTDEDLKFA